MNTALAPNANALSTSVPCLTPPSRYTSTLPLTASTTSPSTSICSSGPKQTVTLVIRRISVIQTLYNLLAT